SQYNRTISEPMDDAKFVYTGDMATVPRRSAIEEPSTAVGDRLYHRIRDDVLFARLLPGQRLKLDRMKEEYGTSIGTLREVLNRLASEGLIAAEGARGFEVAPASVDDLREVASIRLLLECHALRESFRLGDIDWEGRVVAAHHKLATYERKMSAADRSE